MYFMYLIDREDTKYIKYMKYTPNRKLKKSCTSTARNSALSLLEGR